MSVSGQEFIEGITPTNCSAATLLQLIRNAKPYTDKGIIIVSDDTPDIITYPEHARYAWFKPNEYLKICRMYNSDTATWEPITFGDNTVNTVQIVNLAITLAKLYAPGAAHEGKVLTVNAAGNFVITLPAIADNSVAVSKLLKGSGNAAKLLRNAANDSGLEFFTLDASSYLAAASVTPAMLSMPVNDTVIIRNASGVNTTVAISDLSSYFNIPSAAVESQLGADQALPAAAGLITIAHGLASIPRFVDLRLKCVTADAGYALNSEVPLNTLSYSDAANIAGVSVSFDATNILVRFGAGTLILQSGADATETAITRANWNLSAFKLILQ